MLYRPLLHFTLVAEEASFRKAAERAHLSQPALSHSIKTLEEQMGVQLFDRDKRNVKLTTVGRQLLRHARTILQETRNLEQKITDLKSGQAGHLRVGLVPTFAVSFAADAITRWHRERPGAVLDMVVSHSGDLLTQMLEEKLDFFVGDLRRVNASSDIDIIRLKPHYAGMYCRAGHPILSQKNPDYETMFSYGFASVNFPDRLRQEIGNLFNADGNNRSLLQLSCDSVTVVRDVVLGSDMMLLATASCIRDELRSGALVEVPNGYANAAEWGIALARGRLLQEAAYPLIDYLVEVADQAAGSQ